MAARVRLTWEEICEFTSDCTHGNCYLVKQGSRGIILRKRGSNVGVRLDSQSAFDPFWLGDILRNWQEWPE